MADYIAMYSRHLKTNNQITMFGNRFGGGLVPNMYQAFAPLCQRNDIYNYIIFNNNNNNNNDDNNNNNNNNI